MGRAGDGDATAAAERPRRRRRVASPMGRAPAVIGTVGHALGRAPDLGRLLAAQADRRRADRSGLVPDRRLARHLRLGGAGGVRAHRSAEEALDRPVDARLAGLRADRGDRPPAGDERVVGRVAARPAERDHERSTREHLRAAPHLAPRAPLADRPHRAAHAVPRARRHPRCDTGCGRVVGAAHRRRDRRRDEWPVGAAGARMRWTRGSERGRPSLVVLHQRAPCRGRRDHRTSARRPPRSAARRRRRGRGGAAVRGDPRRRVVAHHGRPPPAQPSRWPRDAGRGHGGQRVSPRRRVDRHLVRRRRREPARVAVASSLFPQLLPDPTDATLAIGCGGPSGRRRSRFQPCPTHRHPRRSARRYRSSRPTIGVPWSRRRSRAGGCTSTRSPVP